MLSELNCVRVLMILNPLNVNGMVSEMGLMDESGRERGGRVSVRLNELVEVSVFVPRCMYPVMCFGVVGSLRSVESKPTMTSMESKPTMTSMESKPTITSMESKPTITSMESKPTITSMESKPTITSMESKPSMTSTLTEVPIPSFIDWVIGTKSVINKHKEICESLLNGLSRCGDKLNLSRVFYRGSPLKKVNDLFDELDLDGGCFDWCGECEVYGNDVLNSMREWKGAKYGVGLD